MKVKGIGIDINDDRVNGDIDAFEAELVYFRDCGFDTIELTTSGLFFILNGKLNLKQTRSICKVLSKYTFNYTLHLPDVLNLGNSPNPDIEKEIFSSCIAFSAEAGAEVLVYHSGQVFYELHSQQKREDCLNRETDALAELAEKSKTFGILLTIENVNPEPEELKYISERGLSKEDVRLLHPAMYLDPIAEQVEQIDAPNLGMTLDPGHLNLAIEVTGEQLLASVEKQAHLVKHLHLNDNFGRNPHPRYPTREQLLYGMADCHLPPGMGSMPIFEILRRLPAFEGYIIFEVKAEYREYLPDSIAGIKKHIASLSD